MLSVLKVGGSVLRDDPSYAATAEFLKARLTQHTDERLVGSSRRNTARGRLRRSRNDTPGPDTSAARSALVRRIRSVATSPYLQRINVGAIPSVHRTDSSPSPSRGRTISGTTVRPLRLLAALAASRIVIVPPSAWVPAARSSLGRGVDRPPCCSRSPCRRACELIKDVAGYFTRSARRRAAAFTSPIDDASHSRHGCDLVQRAALAAASQADRLWSSAAWMPRRPLHVYPSSRKTGASTMGSPPRRFTPGGRRA